MADHIFTPDLEHLESERERFAEWVVDLASQCRDNAEFLDRLTSSLPDGFLEMVGEGSTRRAYACPLAVTLKIERGDVITDPLTEKELTERGGDAYLLHLELRRRIANYAEMMFALMRNHLYPRIYGFLPCFGIARKHPCVLVVETCRTLNRLLPGDGRGIRWEDIAFDDGGRMFVFDGRFNPQTKPPHLKNVTEAIGLKPTEPGIWSGNLGITESGRVVFTDAGNFVSVDHFMNLLTFCPLASNALKPLQITGGWDIAPSTEQMRRYGADIVAVYDFVRNGGDKI